MHALSRRSFMKVAALSVTATALAACSTPAPTATDDSGSSPATATSQVEVIVQGWVDSAWRITERAKIYSDEVAEGYTVNVTAIPEGWETKVLSQIAEGTPSWDAMLSHHPFRFSVIWLSQGLIMPIDDYMATSSQVDMDQYWAATIAPDLVKFDCSVRDQVVGVPLAIDTCCQGFNA